MADADVNLSQFHAELGEAKTAMSGGSYALARQKAALAQVTLLGLWKAHSISERSYTLESEILKHLNEAIDAHERAAAGSGGTRLVPIQFGRVM